MRVLRKPTLKSAEEVLKDSLREERTIVIVGNCLVDYEGRASSTLSEGERVVILKPDGTLLIHQAEKREPVNWNPPGCRAKVSLDENGLKLISKRSSPVETLSILFKDLKLLSSFELIDNEEIELVGTEADLVDHVVRNPSLIEEGFTLDEREKPTKSGVIDLYGTDQDGNKVAVEFKRGKATLSAVGQLGRYVREIGKQVRGNEVRGILASPKITAGAYKLLKKDGLEYIKIKEPPSQKSKEMVCDKDQRQIKEFQ